MFAAPASASRAAVIVSLFMLRSAPSEVRIAIDTGGTFTDCVWVEHGVLKTLKVFSTPDDPSRAIAEALQKIGARAGVTLLHGTTVGTNALLQRTGAKVALITTAGFEDVIEIGRQARRSLYDFFFDRIPPLVGRAMRFGIHERIDQEGQVLESPSAEELSRLRRQVLEARPESIAISLLFSFANPVNESRVAAAFADSTLPLSVSHHILPEFREYERTSTVVVNAYLQPLMHSYMEKLVERVDRLANAASTKPRRSRTRPQSAGPRSRIFVMQSSGGITALQSAAREPVRTVLSGPAGGLVGSATTASRSGFKKVLSFDMGGTSTDVALIQGEIAPGAHFAVTNLPVNVPMLEIHTVGAGGGSLARFDAGGLLRVGPESAGADPGPICYGRGTHPTVTDANLLLGRLRPDRFLGGEFKLDLERARHITAEWLKNQRSNLGVEQFCQGVVRVVNANMERALRVVSLERGYDPRDFALVAFGGAGGLHACELAEALAIPTVVIPAHPGALSAFGILASDVVKDSSRTLLWNLQARIPQAELSRQFRRLEAAAAKSFAEEQWPRQSALRFERSLDLRYRGQGYELNVPAIGDIIANFHKEHQRRYGYHHPGRPIELVTVRLRATLRMPQPIFSPANTPTCAASHRQSRKFSRAVAVEVVNVVFERTEITPVFERNDLLQSRRAQTHIIRGPAVITEYSATTVVPPERSFWIDSQGNLIIRLKSAANSGR